MISVKYFGAVAEATNCASEKFDLENPNLEKVLEEIHNKYDLEHIPVKFALNQQIVQKNDEITITSADELALLPPFAGG